MKDDGKQYSRDLDGVADVVWDMVEKLMSGDKNFDTNRAELVIKGGETIVKAKMAKIAVDTHQAKMKLAALKIIEQQKVAGVIEHHDGGGEGKEAEGIEQAGPSPLPSEKLGEGERGDEKL